MAVLEFKSYTVNELSYRKNDLYKETNQNISINPKIEIKNTPKQDKIIVTVDVHIGSLAEKKNPFIVTASVSGE
ncbi:preprotein translocase subunit SecB, partial [Lactobacillus reuteri]|nr:preprotein translocase subunit SecB [Limosilactobacillus reuteri]